MDKSRHSPQFVPLTCSCGLGNGMFLPSPAPFDLTDERRRFFGAHLDTHSVSLRKALVCKNQMKERAFKSTQKSHLISSPFPPQPSLSWVQGAGRLRGNRAWNAEVSSDPGMGSVTGAVTPRYSEAPKKNALRTQNFGFSHPFYRRAATFTNPTQTEAHLSQQSGPDKHKTLNYCSQKCFSLTVSFQTESKALQRPHAG